MAAQGEMRLMGRRWPEILLFLEKKRLISFLRGPARLLFGPGIQVA
jgi:hypothetical protein